MMGESGDKISMPFLDFENALVTKLINLSEEAQKQENLQKPDHGLCGWLSSNSWEKEATKQTGSETSTGKNTAVKESGLKTWKSAYYTEEYNPYKEVETPPKRSKKRTKYHTKRLEELSVPRKIRNKVELSNCSKILLPFNDADPLKGANFIHDKFMKKVALQYPEDSNHGKGNLYRAYSGLRAEISHSASERNFVERSIHDLLSSKPVSHSARSRKSERNTTKHDPILAKTRANVGLDWEVLPAATELTPDTFSETSFPSTYPDHGVELPLPQVKISIKSSDKKTDALLPPIHPKKKRSIGSVTAITQGNLKAGIKSHSISQLRRQALPQTRVILPRLSGSKVEVPLLPRSPDFLHRLL